MRIQILTLAVLLAACSGESGQVVELPPGNDTTDATKSDAPTQPDQTAADELSPQPLDLFFQDAAEEDFVPECEPGSGCFLDPCDSGSDCLSGLCVEHMGDSVCTQACVEECPQGWLCEQIGTGPDMNFACVSPFTHLCRPCADSNDCQSATGVEDVCVDYGPGGNFCGAACQEGSCPPGYDCVDATTTEGATLKQCVSSAGVCSCSKKAVQLGLTTPCTLTSDLGTCTGLRVCSTQGLSACDAPQPAAETCNGVDDDCNGAVDDLSCDDENACTLDSCEPESGCVHQPLTGTECADGDVCTLADHCEEGVCTGTAIDCDDGNPCTTDTCDPAGGCLYSFNKASCDDSDPCTVNDLCTGGQCKGFALDCECEKDSDCATYEDGDVCNGTLVCDLEALPHECVVDPETKIICPAPEGPDADCLATSCHPKSGECSLVPANDGKGCDDGNSCTLGDTCAQGVCQPGVATNCTDGNPCTDDYCDPDAGCVHDAAAGPCDDSNACTTDDACVDGACTGELLSCDDGDVCTTDACHPLSGCTHKLNTAPCDDGNLCTTKDACQLGECLGSGVLMCDDSNPCTDDSCNPNTGCVFKPNQAACDDGNPCTVGDSCKNGLCTAQGWQSCDDSNPCTDDSCDPAAGCVNAPNAAPCDDGDACTLGDTCGNGICLAGNDVLACDDLNVCTDDACDPAAGCVHAPNAAPCDDADACTVDDLCSAGQCQPGQPLACDDGDACTQDSCQAEQGCVFVPVTPCCGNGIPEEGEACDDGNAVEDDECTSDCTLTQPVVPGFSGELGPVFPGWTQCEGYLDTPGGDDIPKAWGNDCTGQTHNKIRLVCGANVNSYRYIDVSQNTFRDGQADYQVNGLIYNANFNGWENKIYADGNHPHTAVSWWGGPWGCGGGNANVTVNNSCSWEASNCFAQNISGSRYLWIYVAP